MTRPWITPAQLRDFSDNSIVKNKSDAKLSAMITIAEGKIISYCHHDFSDEKYTDLPAEIITAVLIIADALSYNDSLRATNNVKSETFDDYSYTIENSEIPIDFSVLGVKSLLDPFVEDGSGSIIMRVSVI